MVVHIEMILHDLHLSESRVNMSILSSDLWTYWIIPFCELDTLPSLSWVNHSLRTILQTPKTIQNWQANCWYLERPCECHRQLYYLRLYKWCFFASECTLDFEDLRAFDYWLGLFKRDMKSCMDRSRMYHEGRVYDGKSMDPSIMHNFFEAVEDPRYIVQTGILMPRMHDHPVERREGVHYTGIFEDAISVYDHGINTSFVLETPADRYQEYVEECKERKVPIHDPLNGVEMGLDHWLREQMYSSAVGVGKFPYDICVQHIHSSALNAQPRRNGYVDRMWLPNNNLYSRNAIGDHHGVVYITGARYEHEREDLIPWVLSTQTISQGLYIRMWTEEMHRILRVLHEDCEELAESIESVFDSACYYRRVIMLTHIFQCHECSSNPSNAGFMEALSFWKHPAYAYTHAIMEHQCMTNKDNVNPRYMHTILPPYVDADISECQMIMDLHHLLYTLSFLSEFGRVMARRWTGQEVAFRRVVLRSHLQRSFGMMANAPMWRCNYELVPRRHAERRLVPFNYKRIRCDQNHRCLLYLDFLDKRARFYLKHDRIPLPLYLQDTLNKAKKNNKECAYKARIKAIEERQAQQAQAQVAMQEDNV